MKDNNADLNKNDRILESWQSVLIVLFGPIIYLILIYCGNKFLLKLFGYTPQHLLGKLEKTRDIVGYGTLMFIGYYGWTHHDDHRATAAFIFVQGFNMLVVQLIKLFQSQKWLVILKPISGAIGIALGCMTYSKEGNTYFQNMQALLCFVLGISSLW